MQNPGQNVPFFRLHGLVGCPHCFDAENFLRSRQVPFLVNIGNNDPIIMAGVKEVTQGENFPILVVTFTNPIEVVVGFKPEDYDRLARLYHQLAGSGAFAVSDSGQQPQQEVAVEGQAGTISPGAN